MKPRVIWQAVIPGWRYEVRRCNGGPVIEYRAVEVCLATGEELWNPLPTSGPAIRLCEGWRDQRLWEAGKKTACI
jgi:hypothetical protein